MGSLRARAAKGVFWTAASNWGDQLARLLVFAILSRLLEPEAFGLVALALVLVGFTEVVAEQGLADALVQRKDLDAGHLDTAFWMSIGFGVLMTVVLSAFAVPIAILLDERSLAPVLVALSLAISLRSASLVHRAILARQMAFRSLALRTLVAVGVGSIFGVSAALLGFGVWSLVAQVLAAQITSALVLWRVTDWRPRLSFNYAYYRDLFKFGKHVVGFRLLNYSNRRADDFIIGVFLGPASLGFYTVAHRVLILLVQVTTNLIDKVAFPVYSRLQDQPERLRRVYYKSTSFAALIGFPAYIGIAILAPEIVPVMFGPKWEASVPVMQVLALLGVVRSVSYLNSSTLSALGKPSWRVVIVVITGILNVSAFLVAVRYGIVAVAIAALCVGYLVVPLSFWAVNRLIRIRVRTYLEHIRGPVVASLLLAGAMIVLRYAMGDANDLLTLGVVTAAGVLIYVMAIQMLARPLANEARELVGHALPTVSFPRRVNRFGRSAKPERSPS
jgi:PST family polysaccharide transporter